VNSFATAHTIPSLIIIFASPDQPAADGTCHFFSLPGALRNAIYPSYLYRDAHDTVDRLYDKALARNSRKPRGSKYQVSQLRFVNKQLYTETCGLAICDSELAFHNVGDANFFLQHCKPELLSRIRCLHVHGIESTPTTFNEKRYLPFGTSAVKIPMCRPKPTSMATDSQCAIPHLQFRP
jgi:hypothetical protein